MHDILSTYRPITLDEMRGIKLMNRTDTKFVTTVSRLERLLELARHDYCVQETDGERVIPYYTVYYDTASHEMYRVHHNGHADRQKVRIRCYVSSALGFLEVKTKNNHGRTRKKRVEVGDFDPLHPNLDLRFGAGANAVHDAFLAKHLRLDATTIAPALENNFDRITLVNNARTERLTIDTMLRFHNVVTDRRRDLDGLVIVELKRDGQQPSPVLEMLRQLRIMPQGFSKYCMGVALTDLAIRKNRFKERLLLMERMLAQLNTH